MRSGRIRMRGAETNERQDISLFENTFPKERGPIREDAPCVKQKQTTTGQCTFRADVFTMCKRQLGQRPFRANVFTLCKRQPALFEQTYSRCVGNQDSVLFEQTYSGGTTVRTCWQRLRGGRGERHALVVYRPAARKPRSQHPPAQERLL
jgi:hypothetical protein